MILRTCNPDAPLLDSREVNPATGASLTPSGAPLPGDDCPACDGAGGHLSGIATMATWIECKACDGSGEYQPEESGYAADRLAAVTPKKAP